MKLRPIILPQCPMVSNAIGMRRGEYKLEIRFFQISCGRGSLCPGGDDVLSGTAEDQEKETGAWCAFGLHNLLTLLCAGCRCLDRQFFARRLCPRSLPCRELGHRAGQTPNA